MSQPETCTWVEVGRALYNTGCDNTFEFHDGTIIENDFLYCPYCGRRIVEAKKGEA
jgi:DNA-directed RNA polymerase subunit RPC12/RpoP